MSIRESLRLWEQPSRGTVSESWAIASGLDGGGIGSGLAAKVWWNIYHSDRVLAGDDIDRVSHRVILVAET